VTPKDAKTLRFAKFGSRNVPVVSYSDMHYVRYENACPFFCKFAIIKKAYTRTLRNQVILHDTSF
jgi:hypothetical protein